MRGRIGFGQTPRFAIRGLREGVGRRLRAVALAVVGAAVRDSLEGVQDIASTELLQRGWSSGPIVQSGDAYLSS